MSFRPKKKFEKNKISLVSPESYRIGIVVSEWHSDITEVLYKGAEKILLSNGIKQENIIRKNVPGSFELPLGALRLIQKTKAIICLGCVIKGETDHFHFICDAVANGIMKVSLKSNLPISFGVLTTNTIEQAMERAGGKFGNKGEEAALVVLKMLTEKNG
ncbi:MAG: 6,7-dimethyl-8-ribityllumazine synthase [Bacteroidota bacterium]